MLYFDGRKSTYSRKSAESNAIKIVLLSIGRFGK